MQVVGVSVATFVALILLYGSTNSGPQVTTPSLIQAHAAQSTTHRAPEFIPLPQEDPAHEARPVTIPAPAVIAQPKMVIEPVALPVPIPEPTETAVSVCLGKAAGSACTLNGHDGTCITLSWSPLTCVPH